MAKKPITPGLYFFHNSNNVDGGAQMTGSNLTLTWAQLEPYKDKPDYARIDAWRAVEISRGKKWVLRIDVHQNRGARSLPGWAPKLYLTMANGAKVEVPDYKHPALISNLTDFVKLIGARYDADPDLVLVQIGLGLYGETHPERNDEQGQLATQIALQLTGCQWIEWCKRAIDVYVAAFPTTELVIMNAPAFPFGCRLGAADLYRTVYPREIVDQYALSVGVGAQNNSLDMWDAGWYTAEVQGSQGTKTVHGSVGPFVDKGRELAMERGSWLAPFPTMVDQGHAGSQSWWCYLNALSKGVHMIFPPNWPGVTWHNGVKAEYPAGVWNYNAAYADELRWMNQIAIDVMAGKALFWAAFDAPAGEYYYDTAQHVNHERGIALDSRYNMQAEWDDAGARPPFYESMFMRRLSGDVVFHTDAGRYQVTCWHRGTARLLGHEFTAPTWTRQVFTADVPETFGLSGSGHLHAVILEPAGIEPPEPPVPPEEPETFTFTTAAGHVITVIFQE